MRSIKNLDVNNKTVFLRLDLNVPIKKGKVVDNNRIKESLETINYLVGKNAKIVIASHLGKVKSEEDFKDKSLKPVKKELETLLKRKIQFSEELIGENLENKIQSLKPKDILLLENIRFLDVPNNLESSCDDRLSRYYSMLVDVFVLDAFASAHRCHASTYGISKYKEHAVGFLVEKEVEELSKIKSVKKTLILGGSKVSDKIKMIKNLLPTTDKLLVGGAMCATFLRAKGESTGKTYVEEDYLKEAKKLLKEDKIILPIDVVTEKGIKKIEDITDETIYDIGPKTIKLYEESINKKLPVLLNGTLGKYEDIEYENGTKKIFSYLKKEKIKAIVCGGDTGAACKKYKFKPYYLSTGGGAALEYLEGKEMPALKIMEK